LYYAPDLIGPALSAMEAVGFIGRRMLMQDPGSPPVHRRLL
jgi:hypothetical protein